MLFNMPNSMLPPSDLTNPVEVKGEMTNIGVHPEVVFHWRKEQFEAMGFTATQVGYLASHRVDLQQMRDLLAAGCPTDLALRILADTTFNGEDEIDYTSLALEAVSGAPEAS